jgi:hypothetical protein
VDYRKIFYPGHESKPGRPARRPSLCRLSYPGCLTEMKEPQFSNDTFSCLYLMTSPVTVAERSKACTVLARSEAGTMGSNPTQGMDV